LLVAAGVRVFARRGIGAARPTDVAAEAAVSEATIYSYFPTRAELVAAVLDEVARYYFELNAKILDRASESVTARLRALVLAVSDSVETDPEYARVWLNWGSAIRAETWPRFLEVESRIIRGVEEAIRREPSAGRSAIDIHPEDLGRLLLGTCEMVVRMQFADRPRDEVHRFIRSTLDKLFDDRDR
jgi:TetR/AcrR family hemagglutinin/protease transcriptional regulator